MILDNEVGLFNSFKEINYPEKIPFDPGENYIEFDGKLKVGDEINHIYPAFRKLLYSMGMDQANYLTPNWNPLGEIIKPGHKVVLKPNFVRHKHLTGGDYRAVVTHPSLIRCVLDYVSLALKGMGEIVVGDAPVQSTDFKQLSLKLGLKEICTEVSDIWHIPVTLKDFRLSYVELDKAHRVVKEGKLNGDLSGYQKVDLGNESLLSVYSEQSDKFRVTSYDPSEMKTHHNESVNEYIIAQTILDADVIINLPKLKTHRKVGLTAALKNLVGINGHKDWLPHYREGSHDEGGDEYKYAYFLKKLNTNFINSIDKYPQSKANGIKYFVVRVIQKLNQYFAPDLYYEGSWYGNDTCWRMVLDLNRLLIYADEHGKMTETPQRSYFTIVDGIIAGEGEGPMEPDAKQLNILIGGANPVAVDTVIASIIGFDYKKIPLISGGYNLNKWSLTSFKSYNIMILSDKKKFNLANLLKEYPVLCFKPPSGWFGYIENSKCNKKIEINSKNYRHYHDEL